MRRAALAFAAAVLLVLLPASPGIAKSYSFSSVRVDYTVQPDGSFLVRERRTYDFDGSFHRAFLTIPRGRYDISGVRVAERGLPYRFDASGRELSGTYIFTRGSEYEIRWFYDAVDERRTFTIEYRVSGAVVAYEDVAELYWKFIGPAWDVPSNDVRAVVHLPAGAGPGEVRAWGHGPLEGRVEIADPQTIVWAVGHAEPHTFVEGRVTFPPRLVPGARRGVARLPRRT